eukprot:gene10662-22255_t
MIAVWLVLLAVLLLQKAAGGGRIPVQKSPEEKTKIHSSLNNNNVIRNSNVPGTKHSPPPSITNWDLLQSPDRFTLTSFYLDHNVDTKWYIPSFHRKYSAGWNRSVSKGFLLRPYSCTVRLFGVGLQSTLTGFENGGTGFLYASYKNGDRTEYIGVSANESSKVHCYYMTSAHYGSDFIDTPKTLGIVIYCPITLDQEIGEYQFMRTMESGYYCRKMAELPLKITITLRNSTFVMHGNDVLVDESLNKRIQSSVTITPTATRRALILNEFAVDKKRGTQSQGAGVSHGGVRRHTVCAVQTFRNPTYDFHVCEVLFDSRMA